MTEQEAKIKLVNWALAQLGYTETGDNHNKYADKVAGAYGWNIQNQPWCDVFVDAGFVECFGLDLAAKLTYQPKGGFSALCSASANYYKGNGAWFSTPAIGDQVFYNVSGGINHTGIVVGVSGGAFTAVEGNSSDMVRRNSYAVNSTYVAGFGRPNWSVASSNPISVPAKEPVKTVKYCTVTLTLPVLEFGDKSVYVKDMQNHLIQKGFSCGWMGADGDFGQQTKIALFEFQKKNGLETDTICGQATYKKLMEVV